MKKILSFIIALAMSMSLVTTIFANADVSVMVDGRTINFRQDVPPTILNDRTYVPVRRVLEAMGARVSWNGENRTVSVSSKTNTKKLLLTIDSPEIIFHNFTSILNVETYTITSDVAPIILGDRTMLPIRVIAEALDATVEYNDATKLVKITTPHAALNAEKYFGADSSEEGFSVNTAVAENLPKLSLACDATEVKEGDVVTVKVKVSDLEKLYSDSQISGLAASIFYDTENFEFSGYTPVSNEGEFSPSLSAENPNFYENAVKLVYIVTYDKAYLPADDGTICEVKFTALNSNGGEFALSDGISEVGYDNELVISSGTDSKDLCKYDQLFVDTTPVSAN